ncbi:MAG: alpha-glucuronidase family glycosyl hydrolase, partial [Bacteroidota bacterium]
MKKHFLTLLAALFLTATTLAEDGYRLWLRYDKIKDESLLKSYRNSLKNWLVQGNSATLEAAAKELKMGLTGLLGEEIPVAKSSEGKGLLLAGTPSGSPLIASLKIEKYLQNAGSEGFAIISTKNAIVIAANEDVGVLYGVFHFLRLLQTQQDIENLAVESAPKLNLRLLNHWDNLDRTVERGYAGFSIWNWHTLPDYLDPRYLDYARANASIGINGTVLTNVNANALILRTDYLEKVKALADLFRPYGIRVYLTARFSAPIELGKMQTADPLDPAVQQWWKDKADEIYRLIPDFGGFVVKANSEGQPGPQTYHRTHADGANLLADALAPHGGIVMWRAFVYSAEDATDRHKQAYAEFVPRDGSFRENVMIQVKNGAIDFQPREPFHPLFGAMPKTPLMMEFQITQEYLGQGTHLVFLAPMWKE